MSVAYRHGTQRRRPLSLGYVNTVPESSSVTYRDVELDLLLVNKSTLKDFLFNCSGEPPQVAFKCDADFQTYMAEKCRQYDTRRAAGQGRVVKKASHIGMHQGRLILSGRVSVDGIEWAGWSWHLVRPTLCDQYTNMTP